VVQIVCVAVLAGVLFATQPPPPSSPLVVSAAISLTDALREIERAYVAAGGDPVRFNFAGSNVLARQIANGAPADIFISADLVQMRYVERAGAVDRFHYPLLKNTLAVVVPVGRSLPGTTAAVLADPSVRRIAIADPAAVPAGFYARKFLQHEGQWERLQPKLVPLANVRAALAAVESGGVNAGIVYESDTAMSNKVSIAFRVPEQMTGPIIYPIALVKRTRNAAEAQRFIAYLRFNDKAHQIFRRHRFRPYETTH
jgi:molybdate transport system substrate-binding protein